MKENIDSNESRREAVILQRFMAPQALESEGLMEIQLSHIRPDRFDDYPGQEHATDNLKVYVEAAKMRGAPLDHVLLHGPPGLGKTTLAQIIAKELGAPFYHASGPALDRPGDLVGIMAGLESGALIFIDEIHRLPIHVEEILYSAMEDFQLDIVVGQGPTARSVRMPVSPFTLVGATTRVASLSRPLLSRFGIQERLEYYEELPLSQILSRSAKIMGIELREQGARALAMRSRGTPRIANRLLRRVRDFVEVGGKTEIDDYDVDDALKRLDIDYMGLDRTDQSLLKIISERYRGGPVGIETLAVTLGEDRSTLEEVYEPFLIHKGLLVRGPRGRSLTPRGIDYINGLRAK
jgi:Holliday junction DNA helicase RuvB